METKKCSFCGAVKPISEFGLRAANKDGLHNWCKECVREHQKEYDAKRRSRMAEEKAQVKVEEKVPIPSAPVVNKETISIDGERTLVRETISLEKVSSREMLEELKKRGYIWSDMYQKRYIDYNKI